MLAEAELDNLRQKRPGISWTRHTLAACFAVLVLASGCLGWWWASAYGGNTTNAAGLQGPTIADKKESAAGADKKLSVSQQNNATPAAVPEQKPAMKEKPVVPAQAAVSTVPRAGNRDAGVRLSAGQMRQLIRSGRQELGNIR
jgi:hypothetical protein